MEENKQLQSEAEEQLEQEQTVEQEEIVEQEETVEQAEQPQSREPAPQPEKKAKAKTIIIVAVIAVLVIVLAAVGIVIAKKGANKAPTDVKNNQSTSQEVVTGEEATKEATVKNADAIDAIKAFSDETLGLKKDDYSFMVAQQAYKIGGEQYVQVIAAEKKKNEDGTFTINAKGKYYISFDGKTLLKEDINNPGTYEELK